MKTVPQKKNQDNKALSYCKIRVDLAHQEIILLPENFGVLRLDCYSLSELLNTDKKDKII